MRITTIAASLIGGIAVYVALAACGSNEAQRRPMRAGASTGGSSSSGDGPGSVGGMSPVPDANAQPATSGARLKSRYYVSSDGARQFVGWFDLQRNEACGFQQTPEGIRCMPAVSGYFLGVSSYYADAACTMRMAQAPMDCRSTPPDYIVESTFTAACGAQATSQVRYFRPAGVFSGATMYLKGQSTCVGFPKSAETFFLAGAEIVPSYADYVSATEQHD